MSAFVRAAFIKLLIITEQPLLCAGLFTGVTALWGIIGVLEGSTTLVACFLALALALARAKVYRWLVQEESRGKTEMRAIVLVMSRATMVAQASEVTSWDFEGLGEGTLPEGWQAEATVT